MQGIWTLSTQLSGSSFSESASIAKIVFNVIFIPGIAYAVYAAWSDRPHRGEGKQFDAIRYGASTLLLWYILNTIDLFLHESRTKVTYIYIIYYFFLACLKLPADILILAGSHRIISGQIYIHHRTRTPRPVIWLLAGEFLVIVLIILALYYAGSLFAYEVLWLQVADATASFSLWFLRKNKVPSSSSPIQKKLKPFTAIISSTVLFIRSISELIIVVRYHFREHIYWSGTLASRDLIYGFTTLGFLLMIPSVAREIAFAESEETRDPLLANIEEDMRRTIIRKVKAHKNLNGGKAPKMNDVFSEVRKNFENNLRAETRLELNGMTAAQLAQVKTKWELYVGKLETRFGMLEERDRSREF
ncbi:hypothetical protein BGZ60DRAFT_428982 [Tricladium varicosporioides]|nr:hypothetical protein BGZ60DRAFT_428982 [Hymenoscyphus varicosporioides]